MSSAEVPLDAHAAARDHFAWLRTQMGLQRTLMAAVRTGVSLIGFGFTVAQFFERLRNDIDAAGMVRPETPRNLGLALIVAGIVCVATFTLQYHSSNQYLRSGPYLALARDAKRPMHTSTYFVAFVVMAIGVAAFASVFLHF